MQLLAPWYLLGLVLVAAPVLLHVIRRPGRRHDVPALFLWHRALAWAHVTSGRPRRRFSWSLLLQMLIVVLLAFALARPVILLDVPRRHIGFILDNSASMRTLDAQGRSRWTEATGRIRDVLAQLDEDW